MHTQASVCMTSSQQQETTNDRKGANNCLFHLWCACAIRSLKLLRIIVNTKLHTDLVYMSMTNTLTRGMFTSGGIVKTLNKEIGEVFSLSDLEEV